MPFLFLVLSSSIHVVCSLSVPCPFLVCSSSVLVRSSSVRRPSIVPAACCRHQQAVVPRRHCQVRLHAALDLHTVPTEGEPAQTSSRKGHKTSTKPYLVFSLTDRHKKMWRGTQRYAQKKCGTGGNQMYTLI